MTHPRNPSALQQLDLLDQELIEAEKKASLISEEMREWCDAIRDEIKEFKNQIHTKSQEDVDSFVQTTRDKINASARITKASQARTENISQSLTRPPALERAEFSRIFGSVETVIAPKTKLDIGDNIQIRSGECIVTHQRLSALRDLIIFCEQNLASNAELKKLKADVERLQTLSDKADNRRVKIFSGFGTDTTTRREEAVALRDSINVLQNQIDNLANNVFTQLDASLKLVIAKSDVINHGLGSSESDEGLRKVHDELFRARIELYFDLDQEKDFLLRDGHKFYREELLHFRDFLEKNMKQFIKAETNFQAGIVSTQSKGQVEEDELAQQPLLSRDQSTKQAALDQAARVDAEDQKPLVRRLADSQLKGMQQLFKPATLFEPSQLASEIDAKKSTAQIGMGGIEKENSIANHRLQAVHDMIIFCRENGATKTELHTLETNYKDLIFTLSKNDTYINQFLSRYRDSKIAPSDLELSALNKNVSVLQGEIDTLMSKTFDSFEKSIKLAATKSDEIRKQLGEADSDKALKKSYESLQIRRNDLDIDMSSQKKLLLREEKLPFHQAELSHFRRFLSDKTRRHIELETSFRVGVANRQTQGQIQRSQFAQQTIETVEQSLNSVKKVKMFRKKFMMHMNESDQLYRQLVVLYRKQGSENSKKLEIIAIQYKAVATSRDEMVKTLSLIESLQTTKVDLATCETQLQALATISKQYLNLVKDELSTLRKSKQLLVVTRTQAGYDAHEAELVDMLAARERHTDILARMTSFLSASSNASGVDLSSANAQSLLRELRESYATELAFHLRKESEFQSRLIQAASSDLNEPLISQQDIDSKRLINRIIRAIPGRDKKSGADTVDVSAEIKINPMTAGAEVQQKKIAEALDKLKQDINLAYENLHDVVDKLPSDKFTSEFRAKLIEALVKFTARKDQLFAEKGVSVENKLSELTKLKDELSSHQNELIDHLIQKMASISESDENDPAKFSIWKGSVIVSQEEAKEIKSKDVTDKSNFITELEGLLKPYIHSSTAEIEPFDALDFLDNLTQELKPATRPPATAATAKNKDKPLPLTRKEFLAIDHELDRSYKNTLERYLQTTHLAETQRLDLFGLDTIREDIAEMKTRLERYQATLNTISAERKGLVSIFSHASESSDKAGKVEQLLTHIRDIQTKLDTHVAANIPYATDHVVDVGTTKDYADAKAKAEAFIQAPLGSSPALTVGDNEAIIHLRGTEKKEAEPVRYICRETSSKSGQTASREVYIQEKNRTELHFNSAAIVENAKRDELRRTRQFMLTGAKIPSDEDIIRADIFITNHLNFYTGNKHPVTKGPIDKQGIPIRLNLRVNPDQVTHDMVRAIVLECMYRGLDVPRIEPGSMKVKVSTMQLNAYAKRKSNAAFADRLSLAQRVGIKQETKERKAIKPCASSDESVRPHKS